MYWLSAFKIEVGGFLKCAKWDLLKQIFEIVQKFLNTNILTCPKIYGHVIWMSDWFNKFLQLFIDKIFLYIP